MKVYTIGVYGWTPERFVGALQERGVQRIALLCVEMHPESCHRSLIAQRMAEQFGTEVEHLLP